MATDQDGTRVNVDLSIFTNDNSFGHVNGAMCLTCLPRVGDLMPFGHSEGIGSVEMLDKVRIEAILHVDAKPTLMLSDVHVSTKDDAFRLSRLLERTFGLFANIHDEDDLRLYMENAKIGDC